MVARERPVTARDAGTGGPPGARAQEPRPAARPGKPVPDPAARPQFHLDGYGEPVLAFRLGKTPVFFRERQSEDVAVRVYYAGAVLLGSASSSPTMVTSNFHHNVGAEKQEHRFSSFDDVHVHLQRLLQTELV